MTPAQLEKHLRWHETHRPGSKADREHARQNREAHELMARPRHVPPADLEIAELERQLAELDSDMLRLKALINPNDEKERQ
jgi:hypothetical protein